MVSRRVVLVTGGSRGIGRAVCVRLAQDGFDIAMCSRAADENAEKTARAVENAGARCFHATCDVASPEDVRSFARRAQAEFGSLYGVVNSAGILRDKPLVLMRQEDWTEVLDTNLSGTFYVCHATAFYLMKQKAGVIVNLSSVVGVHGNGAQSNYAASKAGIIGLTKSLAKELGPYGIRVNAVAPGIIETEMIDRLSVERREHIARATALRRLGAPEQVADVVAFLISDAASYVTGHVLHVDGGLS